MKMTNPTVTLPGVNVPNAFGTFEAFFQWQNVDFPAFKATVDVLTTLPELVSLYDLLAKNAVADITTKEGYESTMKLDYVKNKILTMQGQNRPVRPPKRG